MIIGIVCEYNPFHNGHLYQIEKIKEMYPDCTIIAIMSGNFVQRGEFSILNKYDKTKIALNYGIDLVIELPVFYVLQSADIFAHGAMKLANILGCTHICFGAEHNDINYFYKNIKITNMDEYNLEVKRLLQTGLNYPTATGRALENLGGNNICTSNDILALRYIKEIVDNNYNIEPIIIKRTSDFNDINSNDNIISANNIRNKIKNNIDISKHVPKLSYELLKKYNIINLNDYFDLIKYNILINKDNLCSYLEVNDVISNKMLKWIYKSKNIDEFINNIKSKNDTIKKINRILIHILLNIKKDDTYNLNNIILLGFNNNGKNYLNNIKKNIRIISKFSDLDEKEKNNELFLNYIYYKDSFDISKLVSNHIIFTKN